MAKLEQITSPDDAALDRLCQELASRAGALDTSGAWPAEQLRMLGEAGVYRWFLPRQWGGFEWNEADLLRGYMRLAAACLTTTFILTQRSGAVKRIVDSENAEAQKRLLPGLAEGSHFATVGISHLTTSRRHLAKPVLQAARNWRWLRARRIQPLGHRRRTCRNRSDRRDLGRWPANPGRFADNDGRSESPAARPTSRPHRQPHRTAGMPRRSS